MRTGGYTLQQSLTTEATSIVKQSITLARRRGNAQVTPLHIASAMLASSAGLLRRACLQTHSHPLQCKALELCFNVALNRLPTSTSSPLLGPHSHHPSLSNALVAAFKRAQAHQRRGSVENQQHQQQQQTILALKVEIEQLVISILDDPSVSRVMREAGFSSTQVKTKVEQAVSLESSTTKSFVLGNCVSQTLSSSHQLRLSSLSRTAEEVRDDDVTSVVSAIVNKKTKNTVVLSECTATAESVIKGVIDKFDKGNVPGEMRSVQFVSVPLYTLRNISREEFEGRLGELRSLVKSYLSRGVVLYLGDLKWVSEFWSKYGEQRTSFHYSPVEHMIMELSRLLCGTGDNGKLWIMGIATFQTYMKCKTGCPSLETLWDLHPITIPVGSLALSLNLDSNLNNHFRSKAADEGSSWLLSEAGAEKHLTCCADCVANFKREARSIPSRAPLESGSSLPSWLQQYKEEKRRETNNDQELDKIRDLCTKWNSICKSLHKKSPHFFEKALNFSSTSPCSSASISSNDHKHSSKLHHQSLLTWPLIFEPNGPNQYSPKERKFFVSDQSDEIEELEKPKILTMYKTDTKPDLLSNPNSSPNSASSSEASGDHMDYMEFFPRFKENNQKNLKILCNALEKKVPWQKEIIPDIVSSILECRSGKKTKKSNKMIRSEMNREETWLFFLGTDSEGKEKIARELSRVVFGSQDNFINISLSCFSSITRADSTEEVSNKRARNEQGKSYLERLADALHENPSRVFFMEDFDQVGYLSQKGIKKMIESGSFILPDGELILLNDAIIIFSSDSFSSHVSRASSPPIGSQRINGNSEVKEEQNGENLEENRRSCVSLDLNIATEDGGDENLFGDIGILDLVDKLVVFKVQVV
ncbi:hypothetical protein ACH5RR_016504 [Cinchona calisaya]|uniref:Clp R domain-containing protein n=1 Tax=Cinchona calisaya TaxID=153742 RepID=A0ABD2ZW25_9GENT